MAIIRREDFFKAQMLLRLHGLRELIVMHAGSIWVSVWVEIDQTLCLTANNIEVSTP